MNGWVIGSLTALLLTLLGLPLLRWYWKREDLPSPLKEKEEKENKSEDRVKQMWIQAEDELTLELRERSKNVKNRRNFHLQHLEERKVKLNTTPPPDFIEDLPTIASTNRDILHTGRLGPWYGPPLEKNGFSKILQFDIVNNPKDQTHMGDSDDLIEMATKGNSGSPRRRRKVTSQPMIVVQKELQPEQVAGIEKLDSNPEEINNHPADGGINQGKRTEKDASTDVEKEVDDVAHSKADEIEKSAPVNTEAVKERPEEVESLTVQKIKYDDKQEKEGKKPAISSSKKKMLPKNIEPKTSRELWVRQSGNDDEEREIGWVTETSDADDQVRRVEVAKNPKMVKKRGKSPWGIDEKKKNARKLDFLGLDESLRPASDDEVRGLLSDLD